MSEYTRKKHNVWLIVVLVVLIFAIVGLSISLIVLNNGINGEVSVECKSVLADVNYGDGGEDYATRLSSEIANRIEEELDDYGEKCAVDDYEKALEVRDEKTRFYIAVEYANYLVEEDDVEGALKFFEGQEWSEFTDIEMKTLYYETLKSLFEVNGIEEEAAKYDEIIDSLYEEIGDTPIDIMEER